MTNESLTFRIDDALRKFECSVNLGFSYGCQVARDRVAEVLNDPTFQKRQDYDLYKTRYDIMVRIAKARVLL
jgi:hypothetical protein